MKGEKDRPNAPILELGKLIEFAAVDQEKGTAE
jgi:hypothetical protein